MATVRIATTRFQDLRPLAAAGQAGTEAWGTLHALLLRELSAAHAALLAEPVLNEAAGSVDWYAGGVAGRLVDLPEPARAGVQGVLDGLTGDVRGLAERLGGSRAEADRFLSDMLGMALRLPGAEFVYVCGEQPVLVGWAHVSAGGRTGERAGDGLLLGRAAPRAAAMAILPPPASPFGRAAAARTWLWGVLGGSLLLPGLVGVVVVRDPWGWLTVAVPSCRVAPGELGLGAALDDEVSREGVLRAQLAALTADAGKRRLMCPPVQMAAAAPPAPPAPPPPPAPPANDDAGRAERQGAKRGKLQVILAWDDTNDLDLRVGCPGGGDINYIRRHACGGTLDLDANGDVNHLTASPAENVYFDDPAPGRYRVVVDPYGMRARASTPFRVTVRREGQPDQVTNGVAVNGRRVQVVTEFTVEAAP